MKKRNKVIITILVILFVLVEGIGFLLRKQEERKIMEALAKEIIMENNKKQKVQMGIESYEKGDYEDTEIMLHDSLDWDESGKGYYYLAHSRYILGKYEKAYETLKEDYYLDMKDTELLFLVEVELEKYEEALKTFEKVEEEFKEEFETKIALYKLYKGLENDNEAKKYLKYIEQKERVEEAKELYNEKNYLGAIEKLKDSEIDEYEGLTTLIRSYIEVEEYEKAEKVSYRLLDVIDLSTYPVEVEELLDKVFLALSEKYSDKWKDVEVTDSRYLDLGNGEVLIRSGEYLVEAGSDEEKIVYEHKIDDEGYVIETITDIGFDDFSDFVNYESETYLRKLYKYENEKLVEVEYVSTKEENKNYKITYEYIGDEVKKENRYYDNELYWVKETEKEKLEDESLKIRTVEKDMPVENEKVRAKLDDKKYPYSEYIVEEIYDSNNLKKEKRNFKRIEGTLYEWGDDYYFYSKKGILWKTERYFINRKEYKSIKEKWSNDYIDSINSVPKFDDENRLNIIWVKNDWTFYDYNYVNLEKRYMNLSNGFKRAKNELENEGAFYELKVDTKLKVRLASSVYFNEMIGVKFYYSNELVNRIVYYSRDSKSQKHFKYDKVKVGL